ncbi:DEAD-domain-containing protein [Microthyrium microscopicum]|uniref:ATP-dependent RNA helicase n=1 Tax=Microthyrium microscopicum TaxID=703497 RepID=A0A6A6TX20_9PEZI|nr:DEAD-domain-containing protein [Microthyrium microscopicum]
MTPVQQKVLTQLPSNSSDCLVQAKTGTGKTIAFLLPALQSLLSGKAFPHGQVAILIMAPTRELALQIAAECDGLTAKLTPRFECHTAFGGTARGSNLNKFLRGNPTVLVATPGRLNDILGEERVREKFEDIRTLILDEADRMLDSGFLGDVKNALKRLPPKSTGWQGMCFSATIPPSLKDVVSTVLYPGYTHLSTVDENDVPTIASVPQYVVVVPEVKDIFTSLFALIKREYAANPNNFKTIVFGTTANGVALLNALFEAAASNISPNLKIFQLQSRLNQNIRTRTTNEFRDCTSGVLFASDVVGRGMDFPNVGLVIQLGLPSNAEQYIHRVGRTARAGNDGRAVIVLTEAESYFARINKKLAIIPYPTNIQAEAAESATAVSSAFDSVDMLTKSKAYQAFLGFNKTFMKNLRTDNGGLVAMANEYAEAMQCPEQPMIDKKIVGKMGFKGVRGLRVGTVERAPAPARGPGRGGNATPGPGRGANPGVNAGTGPPRASNGGLGQGRGSNSGMGGSAGKRKQENFDSDQDTERFNPRTQGRGRGGQRRGGGGRGGGRGGQMEMPW